MRGLAGLNPVRYTGKGLASEEYLEFIAEDVSDLVAVLTRVVQVQQAQLDEEPARTEALEQRLLDLESSFQMMVQRAGGGSTAPVAR